MLQHLELLAQHEQLDILGTIPPTKQDRQRQLPTEQLVRETHPASPPSAYGHPKSQHSRPKSNIWHPQVNDAIRGALGPRGLAGRVREIGGDARRWSSRLAFDAPGVGRHTCARVRHRLQLGW